MPKPAPPPTKVQRTADALIAGPALGDVKQLGAAVSAIKRVYYAALGDARRRALRAKLDEHYANLVALTASADRKVATAALRTLPPVLRPKTTKVPSSKPPKK